MPINVNDIKVAFDKAINFPQQGGYTPDAFNVWLRNATYNLFKQRLGIPEQADMASGMPRISYSRTKKIHTDLTPFRKFQNIGLSNYDFLPQSAVPGDFLYETGITFFTVVRVDDKKAQRKLKQCGCTEQNEEPEGEYKKFYGTVELVEEDKWASRANSTIIKRAMYCPFNNGWKLFFPGITPSHIRVEYLKRPATPVWGWQIQNGDIIYNPATSTNVEFDETLITEIVYRMVKEYGLTVDDATDMQVADARIKTGE